MIYEQINEILKSLGYETPEYGEPNEFALEKLIKPLEDLRELRQQRFHASALLDCTAKLKKYEEALQFYAEEKIYRDDEVFKTEEGTSVFYGHAIRLDNGRRAREALK